MTQTGLCVQAAKFTPKTKFLPSIGGDGVIGPMRPGIDEVHGNSRRSSNPTWVYYLINNDTKVIDKIGISSAPDKRYSSAYLKFENVRMIKVLRYNQREPALLHEKIELTVFYFQTGSLPRLNMRFR